MRYDIRDANFLARQVESGDSCAEVSPEIKKLLEEIVLRTVEKYGIDESHGVNHHQRVYENAQAILADFPEIKPDEAKVILTAAHIHDCVDSKYKASDNVHNIIAPLRLSGKYTEVELEVVVFIITNISYSKRKILRKNNLPEFGWGLPKGDHDPAVIALSLLGCSIVADADILDAYDLSRIVRYQEYSHKCKLDILPGETPNPQAFVKGTIEYQALSWCRTIYEKRVLTYYSGHSSPRNNIPEDYFSSKNPEDRSWLCTKKGKSMALTRLQKAINDGPLYHFDKGDLLDY